MKFRNFLVLLTVCTCIFYPLNKRVVSTPANISIIRLWVNSKETHNTFLMSKIYFDISN